ncbi:MAG: DUF4397 domain-containing protein [Deferribacteres bacterium]|nr:DUF4397 domain-containing protein [Deferribacteres bacterium]
MKFGLRFKFMISLLVLCVAVPVFGQTAQVQFIHSSADQDATSLDVYVNDVLVAEALGRLQATAFLEVASGTVTLKVTPNGNADSTIVTMDTELTSGATYVTALAGILPINDGKYDNPLSRDLNLGIFKLDGARTAATDAAKVEFVVFHGGSDAPAVDVVVDGALTIASGIDYGMFSDYVLVDPASYEITFTAPGDAADVKALFENVDLSTLTGQSAVVFAGGFVDPTLNEGGALLALYAVLSDGSIVKFEQTIQLEPGPWKNMGAAPWEFDSVWEDTTVASTHGVAVDPDGKVWSGSYGATEGIRVRNADGTEASFSPLGTVTVDGTEIDLAAGNCRGMATAKDGNILYEKGAQLIKINYMTGEAMAMWEGSGSLENPGIDSEGFIYVGKVVGTNPVVVLNGETLAEEQTIELPGAPSYGRGVNVTPDGKTLFAGVLDDVAPLYIWTTEDFITYSKTDSIYANTDGEFIFTGGHRTTMNWDTEGKLWVSQDAAYSPDDNSNNSLVVFDFAAMEYQRLTMPDIGGANGPRNVAFSPDGKSAYVASFNAGVVWKFTKKAATNMQFIHASADQDATTLDVYMNDQLVADGLGRLSATGFMEVPSGAVTFKVTPHGNTDSTIVEMEADVAAGATYVTTLAGILPVSDGKYDNPLSRDLNLNVFKTDGIRMTASDAAKFDFVLFHGGTDIPDGNVVAGDVTLASGLAFGSYSDYISVDPGEMTFVLTADGFEDINFKSADLSGYAGKSAVVFAGGFIDPTKNEGGTELGLFVVDVDGAITKIAYDKVIAPGPWKNMGAAPWEFDSVWEDTTVASTHGVAVDPDGKVWSGSYGATEGIRVRNADGTEASFSPLGTVTVDGTEIDLAAGNCRGMATAKDGNILYEKGAQLIKINYMTGEAMAMWEGSGSLENPGIDSEGFIYVGKVVGTNPVVVLNGETLAEEQTIELPGAPSYGRGVNVTPDGKTLFAGVLDDVAPLYIWTTEDFITYSKTDSIYANTDGEFIFTGGHRTTMNWDTEGKLWVSQDAAYSPDDNSNNSLVVFDFATMEYQRLTMPDIGGANGPRNVAFSPDGKSAYVASFNAGVVWKFVKEGTGVAETENAIPERFALGQNYPNPFNPSTIIPFDVAKAGHVELKVYNNLGQVVATLVDGQMDAGKHTVTFNPSKLATGIYFYRVQFENITLQKRMLFIK